MTTSRRTIALSLAVLMTAAGMSGAEPTVADHVNSSGTIVIIQPDALNARLVRVVAVPLEQASGAEGTEVATSISVPKVRAGYRIQVFDDNNVRTAKQAAQARKNMIETRFPELPAYVTFNSPYWRVKVGDFSSRSEAESVMAEIAHAFPAIARQLRIVRDRINRQ